MDHFNEWHVSLQQWTGPTEVLAQLSWNIPAARNKYFTSFMSELCMQRFPRVIWEMYLLRGWTLWSCWDLTHCSYMNTTDEQISLKTVPGSFFFSFFVSQRDDLIGTPQTSIYLLCAITYVIINSSIFVFLVDLILEISKACPGHLIMQQLAFYSRAGWKMKMKKSKRPPSNTYLHKNKEIIEYHSSHYVASICFLLSSLLTRWI